MPKYQDDKFDHLEKDIDKIRTRHRQYISYSNEAGAKSVVDEILNNALDECRTPRSPGNRIHIEFDERTGFITVKDNGRGIPTDLLEEIFTSLNMGSNIYTSNKASLNAETLGQNGTGTLAICGLAEHVEITSFRGGTEDIYKTIIFEEGNKIHEETGKCSSDNHGLKIKYKPSKVMGKRTRIIWKDIHDELVNLQYLNKKRIMIDSIYFDKDGKSTEEKYKPAPFVDILSRNAKETMLSQKFYIEIGANNVIEELDGENVKRFLSMDIAFMWTSSPSPYIDSFSNSNNTVDGGDHIDAAMEGVSRFFQTSTKNSMSDRERNNLDIKWDDVKSGLSIVVALRTNYERLYTGQTKHKVVNSDLRKILLTLINDGLSEYFNKNQSQLKDICNIVKMNAKARREGDKVKSAVVKNTLTNWSAYKMKNYDPCTARGLKEYKELFIIEGDSAKGSLKKARDPRFQALFAIRGVSKNAWGEPIDALIGPKGNREFTDLTLAMGCNAGVKFDLNKLQFKKIILATDADVDAYFIRSLLCAFYFRVFPEIIEDGRLYIAEPPLYKVDDKKDPFVVNKEDYIKRYVKAVTKNHKIGWEYEGKEGLVTWMDNDTMYKFLTDTAQYVDTMHTLSEHYKINERLLEMIFEEIAFISTDPSIINRISRIDIQGMMNRISAEFPEIYYDYKQKLIKGVIDGKYQIIEITDSLIRRGEEIIRLISKWRDNVDCWIVVQDKRTCTPQTLSLLGVLKIIFKFQPTILHRYKGLGENDDDDIKRTIMDPNTRTLIRVTINDIENDIRIFNILRGKTPQDALARKQMMREYKIPKEMIDT